MNSLTTALTIRAGVDGLDDIKDLALRLQQAGINTDALATAAHSLESQWANLSTDKQTAALSDLVKQATRLHQLARHRVTLGLDIDARIRQEIERIDKAFTELAQSGTLTQKELATASALHASRLQALRQQLATTGAQFDSLGNHSRLAGAGLHSLNLGAQALRGALMSLGLGAGVHELIQLGDAFANMQARLKLATGDGVAFSHALEQITAIANRTGADLSHTAALFGKLSRATESLGLSQQDLLQVTETISQALQLSGGSAESMNAALTQLTQGLAAGALRGDELNSVMEQSPRLAAALADGLGVSIGKLRQMGQAGRLSAEQITQALQSQAASIHAEFAQLPTTVASSMQVLKNTLLSFVGELSQQLNTNGTLAGLIRGISEQLASIDPLTIDALKNAFAALGGVASDVLHLSQDIYRSLSTLGSSGEQIGAVAQALQSVNVVIGLLSDGVAGIKIAFETVFGAATVAIGQLKTAFGELISVINADFAQQIQQSGQAILQQGQRLLTSAQQNALDFHGKTQTALQAFGKSNQSLLQEQAKAAKAAFDAMRLSGSTSAQALQGAFADYAKKAIAANDGVISETLKTQLAQQGLTASIDETGKASIKAMDTLKKASSELSLDALKQQFSGLSDGLKIDFDQASTGISQSFARLLEQVSELSGRFSDWQKVGVNGSLLLIQALQQLQEKTANQHDLQALIELWQDLGDKGQISAEQLQAGLDGVKTKLDGLSDGVNSLKEAYRALGLQSQAQMQEQAQRFKDAYQTIKDSGTATASTLAQAFKKYATAAIAANDGIATGQLAAELAQQELSAKSLAAGKASVTAQGELKSSIDASEHATKALAISAGIAGDALSTSAQKARGEFDELSKSIHAAGSANTAYSTTNPFGSLTGVENFLKQAGLDGAKALQIADTATAGGQDISGMHARLQQLASSLGVAQKGYESTSVLLLRIAESLRLADAANQSYKEHIKVDDVIHSFDRRIEHVKQQAKTEAKQEFMRQLMEENKRRAL